MANAFDNVILALVSFEFHFVDMILLKSLLILSSGASLYMFRGFVGVSFFDLRL